MEPKIIHRIDKRLAVVEALSVRQFDKIDVDLAELKTAVNNLKLKVAGIAATISLLIGALTLWLK